MIQKVKDALNSSILWLVAAIGAVLYFWKKEKDLETELAETKANSEVIKDAEQVNEADANAADVVTNYQQLLSEYNSATDVSNGSVGLRQSGPSPTSTDPSPPSGN